MPRKWREKGGEEDQDYNGRTALRDLGRMGEQQQQTAGDC